MIGLAGEGCQTGRAASGAVGPWSAPVGRSRCDTPRGVSQNRLAAARSGGAILTEPSAPGRSRVTPSEPSFGSPGATSRDADDGIRGVRDPGFPVVGSVVFATHPSPSTSRIDDLDHMDAKQVWRAALGELQVSLSPANFETWLRDTQLVDVDDQRFRIAVPNGFAKDWLETRYRSLISQTLARIVGYSVQVEFTVQGNNGTAVATPESNGATAGRRGEPPSVRLEADRVGGEGGTTNLNPRYTFANFIVGSANRLAHAARLSVAERPGPRLQPALPVRRRRPRQDPPDARDRQPGDRQVPAQARRLRHEREVHERVHHLDPAGQDRRVPGPLPPDRPAPHRRHPVHRRQGADPGRVLPHVQRDPRGRQADRPVARTGRRRRS